MKKGKILCAILVMFIFVSSFPVFASASYTVAQTDVVAQPRRPIIGWRYKEINRKIYRKQYNYTTDTWIGEWELCK